jgi:UDP-N-acetylglucosamine--N-acetylmuramyl-(pentapeptide) pyrophosphoryl-undecaprenol N-acetylglucosamine transferase
MKVLIAVGGGGHFSPALAVIEKLPKDWGILLVGRKHAFEGDPALSLEYQTANRLGLRFEPLTTGRLQRKITRHTVMSLFKMPVGFAQAATIINTYHPDVVLSYGGYISVPVILAAALYRIPIVIHEQTLHAGLANKIAARFAAKICISWEESREYFPKEKTVLTGNPLRRAFIQGTSDQRLGARFDKKDNLPVIYITGGSGGAHGINVLIEGCLGKLVERFIVIHQTGDARQFNDYDRLEQAKTKLPEKLRKRYEVRKFIEPERVMEILTKADVIIARSGINTVTELLYLGKPSILIPLPYGQRNEQLANAEFVQSMGLAEIISQQDTTPDMLLNKIITIVSDLPSYQSHSEAARKLIHTDAAEKIIQEVKLVSKPEVST